jgi:hypothetical protein
MVEVAVIVFTVMEEPVRVDKDRTPLVSVDPVRVEKAGVFSVFDHVGTLLLIMDT